MLDRTGKEQGVNSLIVLSGASRVEIKKYARQEQWFSKDDIDSVLKDMHIDPEAVEVDYESIAHDTIEAMDEDWASYMKAVITNGFEYVKPKSQ